MKNEAPPAHAMSNAWADFLFAPLPLSRPGRDLHSIRAEGNNQLKYLLKLAAQTGVLPNGVGVANFVHVPPESMRVDLDAPTLVREKTFVQHLFATAFHAAWVKKSKQSFFRMAVPDYVFGKCGLIAVLSTHTTPGWNLPSNVRLTWGKVGTQESIRVNEALCRRIAATTRERIRATDWCYISGDDFGGLLGDELLQHAGDHIVSHDIDKHLEDLLRGKVQNRDINGYLLHLSAALELGAVVFCVPNLFSTAENTPDQPAGDVPLGGGGMQFLVDEPLTPEMCLALYRISQRVCAVAGGIWDMIRMTFVRAEELGYQEGEYMISHEMDTPISVLNREREHLSLNGRLAVDYLELWRRLIKREWSDAMPPEMATVYESTDALLQTALRFGYARSLRRSKVPRRVVDGRLRFWEFEELFHRLDQWLDVRIDLPEEVMLKQVPWAFQAKTWLMFHLIGACHHGITFAFEDCKRFDDWASAQTLRRARISVFWETPNDNVIRIKLMNTGFAMPPERAPEGTSCSPIRSSHFGPIQMPVAESASGLSDRRQVTVCPPSVIKALPKGNALWEAWIEIAKEGVPQ